MNYKITRQHLLSIAYLGACIPFATAQAVPQYTVTDLGSLGGTYNIGLSVNNSGIASGFSHLVDNSSQHALIGQGLTAAQDLTGLTGNFSEAYGINNLGQAVGSATLLGDAIYHAFKWDGGATPPLVKLKDLSALTATPASTNSRAFDINDSGTAVGFSATAAGTEHAVSWQATGTIKDLGTLDGTGNSQATAINASGLIAGFSSLTGNKATHAVLWNGTALTDLGTLGGTHSAAYDVNALGDVVGSASIALDSEQHAFLWQANAVTKMKDLGTLGGTFSEARGISSTGDVVGYTFTTNNAAQKAFLWQTGSVGVKDLNSLLEPITGAGWTLLEATSISEDGNYIAGVGQFNGQRHAFLLKTFVPDTTPPVITVSIAPVAPNATGWYTVSPAVTWSVTDAQSAITTKVGCVNNPAVANTTALGTTLSCSAISAGGTAPTVTTAAIKVDTTLPVISLPIASSVLVPAPNALGTVVSATSAAGAIATYTVPTATDTGSGLSAAGVTCSPASGATFAIGTTTVNCNATDVAGNIATSSLAVTVADTTAPVISIPIQTASIVSATSKLGALVNFTNPTANDAVSGARPVTCAPASGSTFAIGATTVTCSAADVAANKATTSFVVTVADITPPVLTGVPASFNVTATSATGAIATYTLPTATDAISGLTVAGVTCSKASGSVFALGATTVSCNATDTAGNTTTGSFVITVAAPADKTAPVLNGTSAPISVAATNAAGAVVTYTKPTAVDLAVGTVAASGVSVTGVTCSPASGSTFAIGTTPVNCSVSDNAGNIATSSFNVTVADQTAPVFTSCPATVTLTQGQTLTLPTATDNVSTPVVTGTTNNATVPSITAATASLPLGTIAVSWKATDAAGLSATCAQSVQVVTPVVERVLVTKAECIRATNTWAIQGTSSLATTNAVQLYATATVPTDLTTRKIGASVTVTKGTWLLNSGANAATCASAISLKTTAGTVLNNIAVTLK